MIRSALAPVRRFHLRPALLIVIASLLVSFLLAPQASARIHRLTAEEMKLFSKIAKDPTQGRKKMKLDPILCFVARKYAKEMAATGNFSHIDKRGNGPNQRALMAGYQLPPYYEHSKTGNNIESLVRATGSLQYAVKLWKSSAGHRVHVFGKASFYQGQENIGVGIHRSKTNPAEMFCVFLSAHPNESTHPPAITLRNAKGKVLAKTAVRK